MKILKLVILLAFTIALTSCASRYKTINPKAINYISNNSDNGVSIQYKYDLLRKKYAKKEVKKGIKVISIKVTNSTENDLVFGKDIKLFYENENELVLMNKDEIFKNLKQKPATYLLYLLLTPVKLYKTSYTGEQEVIFPIGYVLGPGIAAANMITSSSSNNKFKTELLDYDITGTTIKKGETVYGLIGVRSDSFNAIKVKLNQ